MVQIIEFKKEHIEAFNFGAVDKQFEGDLFNKANTGAIAEAGYTWSMVDPAKGDDRNDREQAGGQGYRVLAMAGIFPLWQGVGEAWSLFTPEALQHGVAFHLRAVKVLKGFFDQGWWRIQTTVRADFETGILWLDRLGFKDEGLMEKYGPDGSDYIRYARVRGGK